MDEPPRNSAALPASVTWSTKTLEFAEQADPDPALSREIEYWIQRSIDTRPDQGRYEVQSIKCRGHSCQILSVDRAPADGNGWPTIVAAMYRQLNDASIRNPNTGVEIGQPMLEMMEQGRGENAGIVTMIGFGKR